MRCLSCDCALSDYESTRKYPSGGYIDLCNNCYSAVRESLLYSVDRPDLLGIEDIANIDTFEGDKYAD